MDRSEVKKLLGFGYNESRVFGFAEAGFNDERFNKNLDILHEIGDKMLEVRDTLSDNEIRRLINQLNKSWKEGKDPETIDLTLLEARSLGYGLTEKTEIEFLQFLLRVEEKEGNWTPSCLKGFLHSLLRHWHEFSTDIHEAIGLFMLNHSSKDAKDFADIIPFIDNNGPAKLGAHLREKKQSWLWAPPTVLMPTTRINYPYFSDTLLAYFQDIPDDDYNELITALKLHNQMRTDKILLPQLILEADGFNKNLLDIAIRRIGDPFDESKWAPFNNANAEQKKALRQARKVLLSWVTLEVIRIFFELLCKDKSRKDFWAKHAHKLSNFTVFGSFYSKQLALQSLPTQSVNRHFRTVDSSVDNCALAMYIGDYVVVEFTEVGALYAYKIGSNYYNEAFRYASSLIKVDELKVTRMPMLYDLDYNRFSKEGRMPHQGYWERRMSMWLDRQVRITDEDDDE